MNSNEIAEKLVELCRDAKWEEAQTTLYSPDAVSIEPESSPAFAKETKGLPAIIEKGRKFNSMAEKIHSLTVSAPIAADNSFACIMTLDITMKGVPRRKFSELCVYEVKDGKIISEEFHR